MASGHLKLSKRGDPSAAREFVEALRLSDLNRLNRSMAVVDRSAEPRTWTLAFRGAVRLGSVSPEVRNAFVRLWVHYGDHVRGELGSDLLLADALRVLLPSYSGRSRRLYRGDAALSQRDGSYGLSWSSDRKVAVHFARFVGGAYDGGGVLLTTLAHRSAIICSLDNCAGDACEFEFLVDRRRLGSVEVVRHYPQLSDDELDAALADESD